MERDMLNGLTSLIVIGIPLLVVAIERSRAIYKAELRRAVEAGADIRKLLGIEKA